MLGAYLFLLSHNILALPFPAAISLTLLCICTFALLAHTIFIQPFITYSSLLPLVSTLALGTIIESLVAIFFGVNVKSLETTSVESYQIASVYITPTQIFIVASAIITLSLLALTIHHTSIGRKIRAVAEHPHAAESIGINNALISKGGFVLSAVLAAFSGILIGYETNLQPTMGGSYTIKAFAVMVLGGLGNIWGVLIGSIVLGLVENLSIGIDFGNWSLPAGYKDAFAFCFILLMLLFRPQGLTTQARRGV